MVSRISDDDNNLDFTWQKPEIDINEYFPLKSLKVRWRVDIKSGKPHVVYIGDFGQNPLREPYDAHEYHKEAFPVLVSLQKDYLLSGKIEDINIVTKEQLIAACFERDPNSPAGEKLNKKPETIANWTNKNYFYDPRGRLHCFGFLMQEEKWGYPIVRVFWEIKNLIQEELDSGNYLSDKHMLEKIRKKLPDFKNITPKQFSGIRERKNVWFPKKSDRQGLND